MLGTCFFGVLLVFCLILFLYEKNQDDNDAMVFYGVLAIAFGICFGLSINDLMKKDPPEVKMKIISRMNHDSTITSDTTYIFKNKPAKFEKK
jgi:hypothetical protein